MCTENLAWGVSSAKSEIMLYKLKQGGNKNVKKSGK